jgi:hypothetical protein
VIADHAAPAVTVNVDQDAAIVSDTDNGPGTVPLPILRLTGIPGGCDPVAGPQRQRID